MTLFQPAFHIFLPSLCAVAVLTAVPAYAQYAFQTINDPNATAGFGTYVEGINDGGTVVGSYRDANGDHGFSATPAAVPEVSTVASLGLLLALGIGSMMLACKKSVKA